MPVLNGAQGIGKSTFIANLGMEWFSDSLNLSDMNDKTAAEKLQGYWIIEIGELAGMKKADLDGIFIFFCKNGSVLGVGMQNDEGGCIPWATEIHRWRRVHDQRSFS